MGRYVGRRVLQMIPVFFGATLLIYAMVFLLPGSPIATLCGVRGCTPAVTASLEAQYHLNQPFLVQYLYYLKGIFTGNLGTTFSGQSVTSVLAQAYPVTIRLALGAVCIETIFGITLGLISGLRRGGIFDGTFLVVSLVVIAAPTFVIGFVLQYFIGVKWRLLPTTAGTDMSVRALIMPACVLGAVSVAYVLRLTRTTVFENLTADYVRTATAKGLSRATVVRKHILRNSLIPVVTFIGTDIGGLTGGAVVTESVFNVHGIGNTLYRAVVLGQAPTVVSLVTVLVIVFIIANLLVDLLYSALDPRIRYGH